LILFGKSSIKYGGVIKDILEGEKMPIRQLDKIEKIKQTGEKLWIEVLNMQPNLNFLGECIYVKGILKKNLNVMMN